MFAAVLAAAALAALGDAADYARVVEVAGHGDKAWLAGCVGGELAAYVGYVLAYRDVARVGGGPRLPYRTVVRVVVASFGATVLGAAAGGQAVNFLALRRAGGSLHEAASRVLALNTFEWAVLGAATAGAGAAALVGFGGGADLRLALGWVVVVPLAFAGGLVASSRRVASLLTVVPKGTRGLSRVARLALADAVFGLLLIRRLLARPRKFASGLAGFPLRWAGDLFCLWCALRAFDVRVPLVALLLAYTSGYVAMALPLPAGGAGGIEASLTYALHLGGLDLASALAGVFVYRAFSFWLELGLAVALLPSLRGIGDALADARPSSPTRSELDP